MRMGWWNFDGWPTAEEWSAWWAFLTFFVTGGAAIAALLQLRAYIAEREDRARPFVIADFAFRSVLLSVSIKNTSETLATDVRLRVDPPFESNMVVRAEVLNKIAGPGYVISQLSPGRTMQWFLDRAPDYFNDKNLPRTYKVTVNYKDPRTERRAVWWKVWLPKLQSEYTEEFTLDIDQWGDALQDTDYDNKNWNSLDRIDKNIKKIAEKMPR